MTICLTFKSAKKSVYNIFFSLLLRKVCETLEHRHIVRFANRAPPSIEKNNRASKELLSMRMKIGTPVIMSTGKNINCSLGEFRSVESSIADAARTINTYGNIAWKKSYLNATPSAIMTMQSNLIIYSATSILSFLLNFFSGINDTLQTFFQEEFKHQHGE